MSRRRRPDDPPPNFLKVSDVAKYFDVDRRTVRKWMDAGLLRSYAFGQRLIRIARADVEAFERAHL
jgi:excisionase family DNA binding protein